MGKNKLALSSWANKWRMLLAGSILFVGSISLGACGAFMAKGAVNQMFTDLPLPSEMKIDQKFTQIYESELGRVGIMWADGSLPEVELIEYYHAMMPEHGWEKEGEFDNGERYLLVYTKEPRSAAISIAEGWLNTEVEINVTARQKLDKQKRPSRIEVGAK